VKAKRFFCGAWLEAFIYQSLKNYGKFDFVRGRVSIEQEETDNELDVVCVYQGKLGIVEAKTGVLMGKKASLKRQLVTSRLTYLKTFSTGAFGKTIFVTDRKRKPVNLELSSQFINRVKNSIDCLICFEDLHILADQIFKKMV
jgi:CRISPR/Cas system-associated exonuclease Cas4 (RecB family)